jgi:hypothetical protein
MIFGIAIPFTCHDNIVSGVSISVPCVWDNTTKQYVWGDTKLGVVCPGVCGANGVCTFGSGCYKKQECYPGDMKCTTDGSRQNCIYLNGCWEWNPYSYKSCPMGCENGECKGEIGLSTLSCDKCAKGESICAGDAGDIQFDCVDSDADGCLDYKAAVTGQFTYPTGYPGTDSPINFQGSIATKCQYGCNAETGKCNSQLVKCVDHCSQSQAICAGDGSYISHCENQTSGNNMGCYDFSNDWKWCQWGCSADNTKDASCNTRDWFLGDIAKWPAVADNYTWALYHFDNSSNVSQVTDDSGHGRTLRMWQGSCITDPTTCGVYQPVLSKWGANSMQMLYSGLIPWYSQSSQYSAPILNGTIDMWYLANIEDSNWWPAIWLDFYNWTYYHIIDISLTKIGGSYQIRVTDTGGYHFFNIPGDYWIGDWHHLRVIWGSNITVYLDGLYMGSVKFTPVPVMSGKLSFFIEGPAGAYSNDYFLLDDLHISTTDRGSTIIADSSCNEGESKCSTQMGVSHTLYCTSIGGYTHWDVKNESGMDQTCPSTCSQPDRIATCDSVANWHSECNVNQTKCDPYNNDQYYCKHNSQTDSWVWIRNVTCPMGCDQGKGVCYSATGAQKCFDGESRCGQSLTTSSFYKDRIVYCDDSATPWMYEWDFSNISSPCRWGCTEDFNGVSHLATCIGPGSDKAPRDLVSGYNAVSWLTNMFNVAFAGGVLQNLVAIAVFGIVFVIGVAKTGNPTFGFTVGFGAYLVPIAAGWVSPVIVASLIGLATYLIFRGLGGRETAAS